jgi:hypothetical protein
MYSEKIMITKKDKSINEKIYNLDDDLKKLVFYDEKNNTLTINNFNEKDKILELSYFKNINKFLVKSNESTSTFSNLNFFINKNNNEYFRFDYKNISIEIKDNGNLFVFELSDVIYNEIDYENIKDIKKNTNIDISYAIKNLHSKGFNQNYWSPLYKQKIKQIKDILDEFIIISMELSIKNNNYIKKL